MVFKIYGFFKQTLRDDRMRVMLDDWILVISWQSGNQLTSYSMAVNLGDADGLGLDELSVVCVVE